MPSTGLPDALAVADWRRRTGVTYAQVRRIAQDADDPAAAHAVWVQRRDELFAEHPASPLPPAERETFAGLPVPPYDPAYRFEIVPEPAPPARIAAPGGDDGEVVHVRIGAVELAGLGRLDLWWLASYGGGLFLPVRDGSAGRAGGTFGGGRYLLDTTKGADLGPGSTPGSLVVDLNFAYNPSCAYDAAWVCPLAPPGNVLAADVPVGERAR